MDLSVLPPPGNEGTGRTEPRFTVRSANSPSYALTRRPGIKKRSLSDQKREDAKDVGQRLTYGTNTSWTNRDENGIAKYQTRIGGFSNVRGQHEEHEISSKLTHNGTEHKLISETERKTESGNDSRGRTEWRRHTLSSRSKSLDCRTGESPGHGRRDDTLSTTSGPSVNSFDEKRTGLETVKTRVTSSVHVYSSAGRTGVQEKSPVSDLGALSWGNSLPSRIKSQSRSTETFLSLGPAGGQSILERIEKLYGSAGFGKAAEYSRFRDPSTSPDSPVSPQLRSYEYGTFPRRCSGEKHSYSPVPSTTTWSPQKDSSSPESSFSTEGTRRPWQGKVQGRVSEEMSPGTGLADIGTRSLDRARSRNSVAAQIRSARASGGFNVPQDVPTTFSTNRSTYQVTLWRDNGETNGPKETSYGSKKPTPVRSLSTDEDVFELYTGKNTLKTTDRKDRTGFSSAASVRNKINQFEALSQKSQSLATGQQQLPRRAFSVPAQHSVDHDGVRKSESAKEISSFRDKWEGLKEEGKVKSTGEEEVLRGRRKLLLDRFISEDMVRPWRTERETNDLVVKDKKVQIPEELGQNSRFMTTLEIPLNRETMRQQNSFHFDETDFSKVSSPEESGLKHLGATDMPSNETPSGGHKLTMTSSIGDEDETPTNTPNNSPFHSPTAEKSFPRTDPCDGDSVCTPVRTPEPDSTPPPHPVSSSPYNNLPDPISLGDSGVHQKKKKQALDLNAWVSGLNSAFMVWNAGGNDVEDDDDDEGTQKDEDSPYDSDSGESSVTITSNMSQSDRKSFSLRSVHFECNQMSLVEINERCFKSSSLRLNPTVCQTCVTLRELRTSLRTTVTNGSRRADGRPP